MTPGQTRVLVLLLLLLGMEVFFNPSLGSQLKSVASGDLRTDQGVLMAFAGYTAGGLALLALAAVADGLATGIVVLLILLVLFSHPGPVVSVIQGATGTASVGGGNK